MTSSLIWSLRELLAVPSRLSSDSCHKIRYHWTKLTTTWLEHEQLAELLENIFVDAKPTHRRPSTMTGWVALQTISNECWEQFLTSSLFSKSSWRQKCWESLFSDSCWWGFVWFLVLEKVRFVVGKKIRPILETTESKFSSEVCSREKVQVSVN